jgi:hypothetical protein
MHGVSYEDPIRACESVISMGMLLVTGYLVMARYMQHVYAGLLTV